MMFSTNFEHRLVLLHSRATPVFHFIESDISVVFRKQRAYCRTCNSSAIKVAYDRMWS